MKPLFIAGAIGQSQLCWVAIAPWPEEQLHLIGGRRADRIQGVSAGIGGTDTSGTETSGTDTLAASTSASGNGPGGSGAITTEVVGRQRQVRALATYKDYPPAVRGGVPGCWSAEPAGSGKPSRGLCGKGTTRAHESPGALNALRHGQLAKLKQNVCGVVQT